MSENTNQVQIQVTQEKVFSLDLSNSLDKVIYEITEGIKDIQLKTHKLRDDLEQFLYMRAEIFEAMGIKVRYIHVYIRGEERVDGYLGISVKDEVIAERLYNLNAFDGEFKGYYMLTRVLRDYKDDEDDGKAYYFAISLSKKSE